MVQATVLKKRLTERGFYNMVLGRDVSTNKLLLRHIAVQPDGTVKTDTRPTPSSYLDKRGPYGPPQTYASIDIAVNEETRTL